MTSSAQDTHFPVPERDLGAGSPFLDGLMECMRITNSDGLRIPASLMGAPHDRVAPDLIGFLNSLPRAVTATPMDGGPVGIKSTHSALKTIKAMTKNNSMSTMLQYASTLQYLDCGVTNNMLYAVLGDHGARMTTEELLRNLAAPSKFRPAHDDDE